MRVPERERFLLGTSPSTRPRASPFRAPLLLGEEERVGESARGRPDAAMTAFAFSFPS